MVYCSADTTGNVKAGRGASSVAAMRCLKLCERFSLNWSWNKSRSASSTPGSLDTYASHLSPPKTALLVRPWHHELCMFGDCWFTRTHDSFWINDPQEQLQSQSAQMEEMSAWAGRAAAQSSLAAEQTAEISRLQVRQSEGWSAQRRNLNLPRNQVTRYRGTMHD